MANYDSVDFYGDGKQNHVQFYNRELIGADGKPFVRPYILIISPGQSKTEVRRPVQDKDKIEYAAAWKAFEENKTDFVNGIMIEMLPGMTEQRISFLKSQNILTIEHLANLSDGNLANIGMGAVALRESAKAYLKNNGPEVSAMGDMLKKMQERLDALEEENKRLKGGGSGGGKRAA